MLTSPSGIIVATILQEQRVEFNKGVHNGNKQLIYAWAELIEFHRGHLFKDNRENSTIVRKIGIYMPIYV